MKKFKRYKGKVIVAMSGGVDSTIAALFLKEKGYLVEGLFMKNWEEDDNIEFCHTKQDLIDAQQVSNKLNIKLHKANFSFEYWNQVFLPFLEAYKKGKTPNPDILCNKKIKFKVFFDFAFEELNADYIATGHYVRSWIVDGKNNLFRGIDQKKDQSYFLHSLSYKKLKYCLFPLGNFTKKKVREIARKNKFTNALKKDSTGLCFIGKRNFKNFLNRYLPNNPGQIFSVEGKNMGLHPGLFFYTLGQRKNIGIGGVKYGNNGPWYVVDKDIVKNRLIVAQSNLHPQLMSIKLKVNSVNWIDRKDRFLPFNCTVKVRSNQSDIKCKVFPNNKKSVTVVFKKPVSSVAPGQYAVFYIKNCCLGGGIIEKKYSFS